MSQRGARMTEFEERDYYAAPRRSEPRFENAEYRTRRVTTRSPPPPVRERDSAPSFLREDARRTDAGPMVLRKRDIETWDRRPRSPSPVRVREERLVHRPRSESPHFHDHSHEHSRTRIVERETERERERARSPSVVRRRSPSAHSVRFVERRRRSPSPIKEHIHTRIIERQKAREPSPSPSPPPLPPVMRGPILEREVITHYTDIDHGVIRAKVPSPPPPPRPRAHTHTRERETDIDISLSKNRTEVDVDIHRSTSRHRSPSRERRSHYHDDDEIILRRDLERIHIDDRRSHRRSHSAVPTRAPLQDEEADYISGRIDSRGRMGEAYHGATKDWAIVDVPPGTEKVRMDGVGGASTETEWSKYSGVRRTKFIPEREAALVPARQPSPAFGRDHHSSVTVYDREREIDVDVDIERRISTRTPAPLPPPPPLPPTRDMWTEMTKDLVCREAIEEMGYRYEETTWFFYVMDYLTYDQVLQLTELSSRIRRRRRRYVEVDREREYMEDWYRRHPRDHYEQRPRRYDYEWDDERVREREVIYDSRAPGRGYMR